MSQNRPLTSTARGRAISVLIESYEGDERCHDLLDELQSEKPLSPPDAALAAELAIGISRHRLTCEHIASRFYRGRWQGLRVQQRVVLAAGVYQLCWLDRIPDYAAVDETVRIAARYGKGFAAVCNAILRKTSELRGEPVAPSPDHPPRRYVPLDHTRGRLFAEDVLPDPSRRPLEYLIAAYSHPSWLVERWHRRFKPVLCRQILESGQRRPPLSLRPNALRITSTELAERLSAEGVQSIEITNGNAVIVRDAVTASQLAAVRDGLCQPQDATARIALSLYPPKRGQFVVDLCAGVGTKSTQAAEMMGNEGVVLAADINAGKLTRAEEAARRLGIGILRTASNDELAAAMASIGRTPDLVLVDAPCMNTGVLARRPEARYRASQRALTEVAELQCELLHRAAEMAGESTAIVYSTCSLEREENEEQVANFLQDHSGWALFEERFTTPTLEHDGGYAALLRKA